MRPFEHDVRMVSRCLRTMHAGFVLRKGVATELRLHRPNTYETETSIRMPLYGDAAERQRLHRGLVSGSLLRVTAFHLKAQASYDRGVFRVARSTPNFVHLEKAWHSEVGEAQTTPTTAQSALGKRVVTLTLDNPAPSKKAAKHAAATTPAPTASAPAPGPATSASEELYFFKPGELTFGPPVKPAAKSFTSKSAVPPVPRLIPRTYTRPLVAMKLDDDETASTASSASSASSTASGKSLARRSSIPTAVRTTYNGVEYRSRLESNFARLLTALNIRFVYEPVKYNQHRGTTYTIDFFLPTQQLYVELKPKRPHVEEERKCEEMSKSGFRVALMYGSSVFKLPFRSEYFMGRSHRDYAHHDALRGMAWIDGVKLPGETVFLFGNLPGVPSPLDAGDQVHLGQVASTHDTRWSHPSVSEAIRALQRAH